MSDTKNNLQSVRDYARAWLAEGGEFFGPRMMLDLADELDNARITLAEDKRVMDEMAARLAPVGEHDHEFEDCCVICGQTWHEVELND